MEDDVLAKVIIVEKEIQDCIETEKAKAREWLEEVRKETEEELIKAEEGIRRALDESLKHARDEAMAKAETLIKMTEEGADRLMKLSDETLREIIMRRVRMILPE